MDCIRMDENHILCAPRRSFLRRKSILECELFLWFRFLLSLYMFMFMFVFVRAALCLSVVRFANTFSVLWAEREFCDYFAKM